ncbi:MAG: hypothetical protein ACREPQ_14825 [Rhodanobacter sp.]
MGVSNGFSGRNTSADYGSSYPRLAGQPGWTSDDLGRTDVDIASDVMDQVASVLVLQLKKPAGYVVEFDREDALRCISSAGANWVTLYVSGIGVDDMTWHRGAIKIYLDVPRADIKLVCYQQCPARGIAKHLDRSTPRPMANHEAVARWLAQALNLLFEPMTTELHLA